MNSLIELKIKFFLCVLEKMLNQDHDQNGSTYLYSLLVNETFLRAVFGLCLEVKFLIVTL